MAFDNLRRKIPWMKDLSDDEILLKASEMTGLDTKELADYYGYEAPSSMMGKELSAGWEGYKAGFGHIGSAMGIPGAAEWTAKKEAKQQALQSLSTAPHSWEEMKFGDSEKGFWPYAGQLLAGSAPVMAEAAGYTLADVATGGALTPAIVARYAPAAARLGISVPEFLGGQGLRSGATFAERRAALAAAEQAAPGVARTAMIPAVTYPSSLGDTLRSQFEESGQYNFPRAAVAAVPYAGMNIFGTEGAITRGALPRLGMKGLEKNLLGRAGSAALATGTSEAINETGQEVANQWARMGVNPEAGLFDPAALERYKESAIGGAILGGLPGGAFGGFRGKPLDKRQPTNLLDRGEETYAEQVERMHGMPAGGLGVPTPEQFAATQAASSAARQKQAEDALMAGYYPPPTPPVGPAPADQYLRQFEIAHGLPPGSLTPPPVAAAAAPAKPKAAANAARDAKTAAAAPVDPVIARITDTNLQLRDFLPEDKKVGKTEKEVRNAVRQLVGDPQSMDEANATLKEKIAKKLTPGQGKGSEQERVAAAEKLIQFYNAINGIPEAEQRTAEQWKEDLAAESAAAAVAKARATAKVGKGAQIPGDVTTVDPATLAAAAPGIKPTEVPAKPTTPEQVGPYEEAIRGHLTAGIADEDLQGLMLTQGKDVVVPEEETKVKPVKIPKDATKAERDRLVREAAEAAELPTGAEIAAPKKGSGTLRYVAKKVLGIPHTTLADRVKRATAALKKNAQAVGLTEDAARALLGLQSSLDITESGVTGTGVSYEGGKYVKVTHGDERVEAVEEGASAREEAAPEVTTEEGPAEGEEAAGEEAAGEEAAVEGKEPEVSGAGWTPILKKNLEGAMEEWDNGRADDDPTWDQLIDLLQLQWVRGYVASYAAARAAKPKEQGVVYYRELGARRKAVMKGFEEYGPRPVGEEKAGADVAAGEGEGGREVGGVSEELPGHGEEAIPPAAAGRPEGEARAEPAVAEEAGPAPEAAPVVRRKRKVAGGKAEAVSTPEPAAEAAPAAPAPAAEVKEEAPAPAAEEAAPAAEAPAPKVKKERKKAAPKAKAAPAVSDAAARTIRLNRARRQWLDAFSQEPLVGKWSELSTESQEEFVAANDDEQALADVISIKVGDPSGEGLRKALEARKQEKAEEAAGKKGEPAVSPEERARTAWGEIAAAVHELGSWNSLSPEGQQEFAALPSKQQNVAGAIKVKEKDKRWKELSSASKEQKKEAPTAALAVPEATQEQLETGVDKLSPDERQRLADFYGTKPGSKKFWTKLAADVAKATNEGIEKVAAAIRSIIAKVAAGVLAVGIVFNPMVFDTQQAHARPLAYDLPAAITTTVTTTKEIRAEVPASVAATMSDLAKRVYETVSPAAAAKAGFKTGKAFIIADKPNGMLYAFHADGSLMAQAPALYGMDVGDKEVGDSFKGGKRITPAGTFTLAEVPEPEYTGGKVFMLKETNVPGSGYIAVHAVWLGEPAQQRQRRLDTPSPADNRISYGCINTTNETFLKALLPNSSELTGGPIFVLPDETAKTAEMFPAKTATETQTFTSAPGNVTSAAETRPTDTPGRNEETQRIKRTASKRREKLLPWAKKKWGERVAPNGKKIVDNFINWFGESVVINPDNSPTVYFHGTQSEFDEFKRGWEAKIATALGFHFAHDPKVAGNVVKNYIGGDIKEGAHTIPVYLHIANPLVITGTGSDDTEVAKAVLRHSLTPEYLHHMLETSGYRYSVESAKEIMQRWAEGKKLNLGQRHYTRESFIESYTNAVLTQSVFSDAGKAVNRIVSEFIRTSGYDGIMYTNTSPMETRGADDKTTYIAFHQTQVKSAIGNNGNFSANWPSIMRSERDMGDTRTRKTPTTAEHARSTLKKLFHSESRFDQRVTIVNDVSEIPPNVQKAVQADETTQAFVHTPANGIPHGYMIASNIAKGEELAIFLHEIGVHIGMEGLVGKENMVNLAVQIADWTDLNDDSIHSVFAQRVDARMKVAEEAAKKRGEKLSESDLVQEPIAYFVEEAVKAGINPKAVDASTPLGRWFRTLWAAVKSALRKMGIERFDKLTPQDIVNLAYGAARLELEGTWHGTAAEYRKFNHKYMSTGEGGQAFAWGSYLAQVRGVAGEYWQQDVLRKGDPQKGKTYVTYNGKEVSWEDAKTDPVKHARYKAGWYKAGYTTEEPGQEYQKQIDEWKEQLKRTDLGDETHAALNGWIDFNEKALAEYKKVDDKKLGMEQVSFGPEGAILRVDVNAEEHELLDWDEPFSKQSQFVKDAFEKAQSWVDPKKRGETLYRELQAKLGSKKAASQALAKMGIKGVRFLDQMSRGNVNVDYVGPQNAHVPAIHAGMERGLTFQEAKDNVLSMLLRRKHATTLGSTNRFDTENALVRTQAAKEAHYKIPTDKRTRNLVIFDEKNIQRVFSQIGAEPQRVRYSVAAGALPGMANVTGSTKKHLTNAFRFMQRHGLGLMITKDIADLAKYHGFGEVSAYVNAAEQREATRAEHEAVASKVTAMYDALPERERGTGEGSVNRFLHDATITGDTKGINRLSAAGQELVKAVFKHGKEVLALKKKLIEEEVGKEYSQRIAEETDDAKKDELRKERDLLLKRYSKLMTMEGTDTYAPLKRFGDYVVSAKSKEYLAAEDEKTDESRKWISENQSNPAHVQVRFADTQGEADAIAEEIQQDMNFKGGEVYAAPREADIDNHRDLFRAFPALQTKLAAEYPMAEGKVSPMARVIRDLYLQALAENHARKSELRRKGIAGASLDMVRAFVTQGRADAHYLASLKHNDALQDAVQAMRAGAKRDRTNFRPYLNEMLKRHAASYENHSNSVANRFKRVTSIWMLATNPTYYLQQVVQPWMMSLPVIAGKHGYFRTARALQEGYKALGAVLEGTGLTGEIDWTRAPADVRDMLNTVSRNGAIDITNSMDQGEWQFVDKGKAGAAWNRVDKKLRGLNTRVEAINRASTAIASYRLELARNGGDKVAATEYAEDMVRQTHGSYDASNTPRYMQGPVAQVATQFRRFQIIQISLIFRLFHNAFWHSDAKEKAIAKRALTYTLLHAGAIGGALGLPGAALITSLVARLFGPDDEPPDFEKWAREAINDQVVSDLLLNGVPAMLGFNMSPKFGMGQMLSIAPFADFPYDRKSFEKYAFSALGPTVGLGAKAVDGLAQLYAGQLDKGAELLLPTGVGQAMKGYRYGTEGVSLRKGDTVLSADEIGLADAIMQGLGLPTTTITHQQRLSQVKYEFDTYYKDRTTELIRDYQQARKAGESVTDVMQEWRDLQEARVRNGYARQPISTLIKSAQQQRKYERDTAGGVEFTKANRQFVQRQANL